MQLQSETCFELMPDIEALSLASKRALELDMLVDVCAPALRTANPSAHVPSDWCPRNFGMVYLVKMANYFAYAMII